MRLSGKLASSFQMLAENTQPPFSSRNGGEFQFHIFFWQVNCFFLISAICVVQVKFSHIQILPQKKKTVEHPFERRSEYFRVLQDFNISIYPRLETLDLGMPDLINIGDMRGLLISLDGRIVLPPGRVFDHQRKRIKTLGK